LAFLLVLTLFSNTIRNRSLPEVAVQYTTSDSVSGGIRVSGTVKATDSYSIMADSTRTVAAVLVRNGDTVAAGDVLIELEDEESAEVTAARKQLEALQEDYDRALLTLAVPGTEAETQAVGNAQAAYDKAVRERDAYKSTLAATAEKKAVDTAVRNLESLKKWFGEGNSIQEFLPNQK
jgi:multidrug efflux pump subunit AcrA (membrane-fusion protein)